MADDSTSTIPPVIVTYCQMCSLPPEYCEWNPDYERRCKPWILQNCPEVLGLSLEEAQQKLSALKVGDGAAATTTATAAATTDAKGSVGGEATTTATTTAAAVDTPAAAAPAAAAAAVASDAKPKKKKGGNDPVVLITRTQRNKRKFVTTINGLDGFGVKLADAAKLFAKKFSCGSSVTKTADGREEIDIQGDVSQELADIVLDHPTWKIPEEVVFLVDGKSKSRARG